MKVESIHLSSFFRYNHRIGVETGTCRETMNAVRSGPCCFLDGSELSETPAYRGHGADSLFD